MTIRAFLVDCDPGATLGGACARDLANLSLFLMNRLRVPSDHIRILLTQYDPRRHGNRPHLPSFFPAELLTNVGSSAAWREEYARFRDGCSPGDLVLIYLTGHGYQKPDRSGEELDGLDEFIMVRTLANDGVAQLVTDDEMYDGFVLSESRRRADARVRLRLISDTCHSGTMFDLPYSSRPMRVSDVEAAPSVSFSPARADASAASKVLQGVDVCAIGGCADASYGVNCVGTEIGFGGALTIHLLEAVKAAHDPMKATPGSEPILDFLTGCAERAIHKITYGLCKHVQVPVLQIASLPKPDVGKARNRPAKSSGVQPVARGADGEERGPSAVRVVCRRGMVMRVVRG